MESRRFGLRAALTLLVVIAIAPVFAVVVRTSFVQQQESLRRAEASLQSLVDVGALQQEEMVEGVRRLLSAIASAPPVYGSDVYACADYLQRLQANYPPQYGTFGVLDPQGMLTCRASPTPGSVRSNDRRFFRDAVGSGRFTVGEYMVSRASGRKILVFGMPVYNVPERELRGVAYVALDLQHADRSLRRLSVAPEVTLLLTDDQAVTLASAGPLGFDIGTSLPQGVLRDAVSAGRTGLFRSGDEDGDWIYALRSVSRDGERKLMVAGVVSEEAVRAPLARQLEFQLGALACITLLAAALAWTFADRVLIRPMRRLLREVRALASEERSLPSAPPGAVLREIDDLHRQFHSMARSLAERAELRGTAEESLRLLNESLERRVEERTRELGAANQDLESFSYSVSHDLRAPLQVIDGFSQALATRHAGQLDDRGQHYLVRIRDNTRRMSQLIDDLLALARVTRTEIFHANFNLAAIARDVALRLRQRDPHREVAVDIEEPLLCAGDPRLAAIVLENLMGNAWKFTGRTPEARIHVGSIEQGGEVAWFVEDNGAGFDAAYGDKLFKAFQRLHRQEDFEGTGIGLATVQRIVQRHGGRAWAESQPDVRTVFYFTLSPPQP